MFVIFFLVAVFLIIEGFLDFNRAANIMQQIASASIGGTGLVMLLAGTLDAWAWHFRARLGRIEKAIEKAPTKMAEELDRVLTERAQARARQ